MGPAVGPAVGRAGEPAAGLAGQPVGLAMLAAAVQELAAQDLTGLPDGVAAERVLALRGLLDRLEGQWLRELAAVDARGAAGAERGGRAASTAGWLRARARLTAGAACQRVRVARALHRGPLPGTAAALAAGALSYEHAVVLATGTGDLDAPTTARAEPVLLEAARRLDPGRLRRVVEQLRVVADPDRAEQQAQRRFEKRGLHVAGTWQGMVALAGLLDPEAGETLLQALDPLTRPAGPHDHRTGAQRRADALTELARRSLAGGRLPDSGGVRPQVTVTIDLAALLGRPGAPGVFGWAGPVGQETARRLACDAAMTRVVCTRHPTANRDLTPGPDNPPTGASHPLVDGQTLTAGADDPVPGGHDELLRRLREGLALLPPALGGARSQVLDVGRTTRVVPAGLRTALAVRDKGCVVAGCDRPPAWCDAHHLRHWLHGGPTSLDNLVLVCRAHHRAVHEGHQHLARGPTGHHTLTGSPPPQPTAA
ncbi:MAG TPA: DUF222 domain-containing protein [Actinomycetes bacterium]|nr:DUF222 domain-containing protein [Actinomycetes bacterium]